MRYLVKDILKLVNHPNSKKLKLVEKTVAVDDNGHIFFLLTPGNIMIPQKYFWEEILKDEELLDSIEDDSLQVMLDNVEKLRQSKSQDNF